MVRTLPGRAGKAGVFWALAFFFLWSCAHDRVHADAKPWEIQHELNRLFPPGSPADSAREFLTNDGFVCSDSNGEFAGTTRRGPFVFCDRSRARSFWISRRVQIAIFHEQGKIVETAATAGLIGP